MEEIKFNHTLPIQLRFNDVDKFGHVNNTVYFSFYDLGKASYFETVKGKEIDWKDADIVIYDKDKDFTISVNNMHSDYDHTIWEGKKLHGYPVQTYLRGKLVYDNGDFVGTPGMGDYVKRSHR